MTAHVEETSRIYQVAIARTDATQAVATARDHQLSLNIKKGDGTAGFTAAETLLAALGACLLTNLGSLAAKMRLPVSAARVEIRAVRQEDPPGLSQIEYQLIVTSTAPLAKLQELHALAVRWGTVSNTLISGVTPQGTLRIEPPDQEDGHEHARPAGSGARAARGARPAG